MQALDDVERCVPAPDVTVLVTLDEAERVRRMDGRGYTVADRETLAPAFRECVHREMNAVGRREALRPTVEVDVTGCDPEAALDRVLAAVHEATQQSTTRNVSVDVGSRDRFWRQYFAGKHWDDNPEFRLKRRLVMNSHDHLPDYPYVVDDEWEVQAGRANRGRGDLVFTDGHGAYAVVEVKYVDKDATGPTACKRRNRHRGAVTKQALKYARVLQHRHGPDVVVTPFIYTNEGFTQS